MSGLPVSTFVAYLTGAGHSEIIFVGLRAEMLVSNMVSADLPHQSIWQAVVGTRVHKTWWSRETPRFSGFSGEERTPISELGSAGLMDESRVKFELHFEVIVVAAEEPKKSEEHDEPEMHSVTGQREKLDLRRSEQEKF